MEDKERCTQTEAQGEFQPLASRVSTISICTEATNHTDCEGFHQHKEHNDLRDPVCFMNQQMDKFEECNTELPSCWTQEMDEIMGLMGQQMAKDAELPQQARKENDGKSFLAQEMCEPEKCDIATEENEGQRGLLSQQLDKPKKYIEVPQHKSEGDDQKSDYMIQVMDKLEECDIKLPQQSMEENDEKSAFMDQKMAKHEACDTELPQQSMEENDEKSAFMDQKMAKHEACDPILSQHFKEENDENSGFMAQQMPTHEACDTKLPQHLKEENVLLLGDIRKISWISSHLIEQAWKEMSAFACMLCNIHFHPIMCGRITRRFCGGIFCGECTRGRSLLPPKFHENNPQRVCDVCCVRLESVDLGTLRSWANFPWARSMEYEIYKATNTIRGYNDKVGSLGLEKAIPDAILRQAKGLAILTIVKVGMMVTYNIGTGLVIARKEDGSWSPPSSISSFGVGWGAQAGGELIDLIIVLRTSDAIKTFSGDVHLSMGAGLSAAVGIVGRVVEADVRAGDGGYAACYTYSCSKGAFVGCSLEGSVVTTRTRENFRFYGSQSINASDILLGSLPRPPAAAILYRALGDLYQKLER
ncbi:SH3 domain-containing protein PJ696.02 [Camellia lanceoleosa]|uniref:SH3 domain-containing protein PJ696.02 n=1 Tax=Camellia lanceoleosa TaxID=1840588 RepID=A0ACC0GKC2_9ERIC|nr:SH3 domain-containing protein PJ696.02 [Camellia lanceoleosa]